MTGAAATPITLDVSRVLCARHVIEVLTAGGSVTLAALLLFGRTLRDDTFLAAAGFDAETGALARAARVQPLLTEFAPLCCFTADTWPETLRWTAHPDDIPPEYRNQEVNR